jgi:hypothetical protein
MFPERFDIFSGVPARDAVWIETVDNINAAQRRMTVLAEKTPGPYFIYSSEARQVVALVDTTVHS